RELSQQTATHHRLSGLLPSPSHPAANALMSDSRISTSAPDGSASEKAMMGLPGSGPTTRSHSEGPTDETSAIVNRKLNMGDDARTRAVSAVERARRALSVISLASNG